ncbi:MAG: acyl-CoA thioesterase [archaeon]|nr:acyl-CoA thioesterase [archaeon]
MSSDEEIRRNILKSKDSTKVKVRFNDTDAMGVVHFKNYLVYFDDGFVSFMNKLSPNKRIEETVHKKMVCAIKHVDITYENSAIFGDYVIVKTNVKKIGNTSITFHHDIYKESDNVLLATIDCTRFFMDLNTKKLMKVIDFFSFFLN